MTNAMEHFICVTCGTPYPASATPPAHCPICLDDRQYLRPDGQQWTTLTAMRASGRYTNAIEVVAPGVTGILTQPEFAIGQQAHLIQTPHGNLLWDCISYLDDTTVAAVNQRGGLAAIAISHPHFFSSMVAWSEAFDHAPIWLHADFAPWVMHPAPAVHFWEGETHALVPGVTLIRCGGHFPGSTVLHWLDGAAGRGALFTGDTITVVADRRWVSFMYSYPNTIPIDERTVRHIVTAVEPYSFDVLYGGWRGRVVAPDAKGAVARSAERYIRHVRGEAGLNNTPPIGL